MMLMRSKTMFFFFQKTSAGGFNRKSWERLTTNGDFSDKMTIFCNISAHITITITILIHNVLVDQDCHPITKEVIKQVGNTQQT